jgi:two-component system sensor histidine kinase DegS
MSDEAEPSGDLPSRLSADIATLDTELAEIGLLVEQAKGEAARHESRRTSTESKLAALGSDGDVGERLELTTSLVTLSKRAALMESQVDVLEGKRRALQRYRDAVAGYAEALGSAPGGMAGASDVSLDELDPEAPMPVAVSRLLSTAQEDLRREIAREMHDGPAQSLTNIVLQAQIVDRLVVKDPQMAVGEIRQLVAMVQQTLDATKSFIFDVRPMVLDDLGLVPTLRRATGERGRRTGVAVEFDSMGQDRRLPMELESGLFRMIDEALAAYLAVGPDRASLRLDWGARLEVQLTAARHVAQPAAPTDDDVPIPDADADLPPALAAMVEDRRAVVREASEAAEQAAIVELPAATWRDIQGRAASLGVQAERLGGGGELRLVVEIPSEPGSEADGETEPATETAGA